jgi:ABC-type multidrug transport system ATPase subunit
VIISVILGRSALNNVLCILVIYIMLHMCFFCSRLTVEEHLWFFARLKGLCNAEAKAEVERMIKDVGLPHKRNARSVHLSGE